MIATQSLDLLPVAAVVHPGSDRVYMAGDTPVPCGRPPCFPPRSGGLTVIDTITNALITTLPLRGGPLAVDPTGTAVYVGEVNGIVFLDVQVGLGNLKKEVEALEPYLKLSQVHLAIDPEFSMKTGDRPGTVIGTVDALDINTVAEYLAQLVRDNNLPPKILIVHRFTLPMITNYEQIVPLPEVQIVIDMDGWGSPAKKFGTYNSVIYPEPVQFTGFKLFYKNDLRPPSERILTPAEILKLKPQPVYIQYQ